MKICGICLAQNIRLTSIINTNLLQVYERLTLTPLKHLLLTEHTPLLACYICYAHLRNSQVLMQKCLQAKVIFQLMLEGKLTDKKFVDSLSSHHMYSQTPVVILTDRTFSNNTTQVKLESACDDKQELKALLGRSDDNDTVEVFDIEDSDQEMDTKNLSINNINSYQDESNSIRNANHYLNSHIEALLKSMQSYIDQIESDNESDQSDSKSVQSESNHMKIDLDCIQLESDHKQALISCIPSNVNQTQSDNGSTQSDPNYKLQSLRDPELSTVEKTKVNKSGNVESGTMYSDQEMDSKNLSINNINRDQDESNSIRNANRSLNSHIEALLRSMQSDINQTESDDESDQSDSESVQSESNHMQIDLDCIQPESDHKQALISSTQSNINQIQSDNGSTQSDPNYKLQSLRDPKLSTVEKTKINKSQNVELEKMPSYQKMDSENYSVNNINSYQDQSESIRESNSYLNIHIEAFLKSMRSDIKQTESDNEAVQSNNNHIQSCNKSARSNNECNQSDLNHTQSFVGTPDYELLVLRDPKLSTVEKTKRNKFRKVEPKKTLSHNKTLTLRPRRSYNERHDKKRTLRSSNRPPSLVSYGDTANSSHSSDRVASDVTIETTEHTHVENINHSITDNTDTSNMMQLSQYRVHNNISPRESARTEKMTSNTEFTKAITANNCLKRRKLKKDFCVYCKCVTYSFAKHVTSVHSLERGVQKILSYPGHSRTRRKLLAKLRQRGENSWKSIQSKKNQFKRKPIKICSPLSKTGKRQVDGQQSILRKQQVNEKLEVQLFVKMKSDELLVEAKKDRLIYAYGAQYMGAGTNKSLIATTSLSIRKLSKLVIEIKKLKPTIVDLMDALEPQNYDLIVTATKNVSNYNDRTKIYGNPFYAINMSTKLTQCCNIALMMLKSDRSGNTAVKTLKIKALIRLIESNWRFDVSNEARSGIFLNKMNSISIIPLASDLKLLNNYLCQEAQSAAYKLKSGATNIKAYITLAETIYCRILLLNGRRRPVDLQELPLATYQECLNNSNVYEEFDRDVTDAEKMIIKYFKRIMVIGKRGRGVALPLTDEVHYDIDLLISVRRKYVRDTNHYLFAKPRSDDTTLRGCKVLEKYTKASGAKNPEAITTTQLWKQLAIFTQMFHMRITDIKQLANIRLSDDVFQIVKLSNLLLQMKSGDTDYNNDISLRDIDKDLEQDTNEEKDQNDVMMQYEATTPTGDPNEATVTDVRVSTSHTTRLADITNGADAITNKKRKNDPWITNEKNIVTMFKSKDKIVKHSPKRHKSEELRDQHP